MACVYAAQQDHPRRTVALKVMKAAVASPSAMRRFRREVQILGKLRHIYIAQIYEAGTHTDSSGTAVPYFAMEYVPGAKTILEYAAQKDLETRERLKLFTKVCAAISHGHRLRIVHRDIKPANILIDAAGEPKIIDFGVAQAAEVDPGARSIDADSGRLIGTIQYMSPEQVGAGDEKRGKSTGRGETLSASGSSRARSDIDARADVYALGVLLYRLLCRKMPYELDGLPVHEAVRIIAEQQPQRPSEVRGEISGDLETILLKALAKDRSKRYSSAGSLGRDIVRYLSGRGIHARRTGMLHRARTFLHEHRSGLGGALATPRCPAVRRPRRLAGTRPRRGNRRPAPQSRCLPRRSSRASPSS
jgi:serine/threonine protein kinase